MELKASFLRSVSPGRILGRGWVVRRDRDVAFAEGSLSDPDGETVATAPARVIAARPTAQ
jgi:acyl-coenzyme A thioesterase PaaI-like protein